MHRFNGRALTVIAGKAMHIARKPPCTGHLEQLLHAVACRLETHQSGTRAKLQHEDGEVVRQTGEVHLRR
jgi:hypothetical protein